MIGALARGELLDRRAEDRQRRLGERQEETAEAFVIEGEDGARAQRDHIGGPLPSREQAELADDVPAFDRRRLL